MDNQQNSVLGGGGNFAKWAVIWRPRMKKGKDQNEVMGNPGGIKEWKKKKIAFEWNSGIEKKKECFQRELWYLILMLTSLCGS